MTPTSQDPAQALPWPAWLDVLSAVFPPRGTVVVGAGAGNGPWVQWLRSRRASPVWLVEGDEAQYQHLLRHLPEGCDWAPRRDVVAQVPARTTFHRASNPAEHGLVPPERLRTLWPHLAEEGVVEVEAPVTLEALLAEAGDEANWLVLDCLPAAQLLQGGAPRLGQLDVALVRVAAGEDAGLDRAAHHDAVDELLEAAGLVCVHTRSERHPALAHALYVRELTGLQAQLAEARSQAAKGRQKVNELTHSLHTARQALDEAKQSHALALQQAQADASRREAELRQQQEAWHQEKAELEKRLESSDAKLDKWGKSVESSIQREVANAVKQIEAFATLQGYLASGDLMPAFHGWPVSPDFALLVIELLEHNRFDAVIEFGSGSSTLLVARALAHLARKHPEHRRPIQVAFEHLEEFHAGTANLLERAGLRDEVMLVLAPLKPMTLASGEVFNYYDPGDALADVAQRLAHVTAPRILAIVDGPPESTGPLARYPVLELLLDAFPRQEGSYLLDDYRRRGEQETALRWEQLIKGRGFEYERTIFELEKMAYLLKISPCRSAGPGASCTQPDAASDPVL